MACCHIHPCTLQERRRRRPVGHMLPFLLFVALAFEDRLVHVVVVESREQFFYRLFGVALSRVNVLSQPVLGVFDRFLDDLSGFSILKILRASAIALLS